MKKPDSLRSAVTAAVPSLVNDPDKLLVFVEKGQATSTGTLGKSFQYTYTLSLILTDWSGNPDEILYAVLEWVRVQQPELLSNPDKQHRGIRFDVDVLNHQTFDLAIELELSEGVIVSTDATGKVSFKHADEPVSEWTKIGALV